MDPKSENLVEGPTIDGWMKNHQTIFLREHYSPSTSNTTKIEERSSPTVLQKPISGNSISNLSGSYKNATTTFEMVHTMQRGRYNWRVESSKEQTLMNHTLQNYAN